MLKRVKNKNKNPRTNKTYTTQRGHMFILYSDIQITYLIILFLNQCKILFLRITAKKKKKNYCQSYFETLQKYVFIGLQFRVTSSDFMLMD